MSADARSASERITLVTGGSTGFGREIVLALAGRGQPVVAAFRGSRTGFEAAAADLQRRAGASGVSLTCQPLDVSDDASVRAAVEAVLDRHGRIDSLVNCAGIGLLGPMECTSVDQARMVFETNVLGTMRMVQAVVPGMRAEGGGTILNVGSDVGVHANFYQAVYAASKFAVHGLSQVMRWELQTFGIRVAVIDPGWYTTEFGDSIISVFGCPGVSTAYQAQVAAWDAAVERVEVPNQHPEEVARLVLDVLEQSEPRFLNPVGWDPVRMAGVNLDEIDEYEARLFNHYGMAAFRGPGGERDA